MITLLIVLPIVAVLTPLTFIITVTIDKRGRLFLYGSRFFIRMLFALNFCKVSRRFKYRDAKRPREKRIYILNHQSLLDGLLFFFLPGRTKFMAKESWARIPLFGLGVSAAGNIPIQQNKKDGSLLGNYYRAQEILETGHPLIIFPEGTRSRTSRLGKFYKTAFMLALEQEAEIIPVVLDTWHTLRPGSLLLRDLKFTGRILSPMQYDDYKNLNYSELSDLVRFRIAQELLNIWNKQKDRPEYYRNGPYYTAIDNELAEELANYLQSHPEHSRWFSAHAETNHQ